MANICLTYYVIEGEKEEVKDLYKKLNRLLEMEKSLLENGFGKGWLGNIVGLFGGDTKKTPCRGDFSNLDIDANGTLLYLNTETSWVDMPEVFDLVMSKYKTLSYYFRAEECGVAYHATNDVEGKYFSERYVVETSLSCMRIFENVEEICNCFEELTSVTVSNIEELGVEADKFNENDRGDFFCFHEIEVVTDAIYEEIPANI